MPKQGCNYGDFLLWTMGTDRLYPLFKYFKDVPSDGIPPDDPQREHRITAWYDSLGPDMVTDDDKMGYNIGDVVGIALLMRFITSTDDGML